MEAESPAPTDTSADFPNLQDLLHPDPVISGAQSHAPATDAANAAEPSTTSLVGVPWLAELVASITSAAEATTPVPAKEPQPTEPTPEATPLVEYNLMPEATPEVIPDLPTEISPEEPHEEPEALEETTLLAEPEALGLVQAPQSIAEEIAAAETWNDQGWESRGVGLVFGGAILILLALLLVCCIPAGWVAVWKSLKETGAAAELTRAAWLRTYGCGVPALALVAAGVGSLRRRRWAVPLVHAGGWFVAISSMMILAVLTAGYVFVSPDAGAKDATTTHMILRGLLATGIAGVGVPLVIIAIYQRKYLPFLCARADAKPRWTDGVAEPLLMLWLACWFMVIMLGAQQILRGITAGTSGAPGYVINTVLMLGAIVAAQFVVRRQKLGWWLAAGIFIIHAGLATRYLWITPWHDVLTTCGLPVDAVTAGNTGAPSPVAALCSSALLAPQLIILIMARGCFPKELGQK